MTSDPNIERLSPRRSEVHAHQNLASGSVRSAPSDAACIEGGAVLLPLSAAQRGVWFAQQINPAISASFKAAEYLEINGAVDQELFEAAVRQVVEDMESLRVTIVEDADGPKQRLNTFPSWSFPIVDFCGESDPADAAHAWMRADMQKPVDLACGPLFSLALLRIDCRRFFFYFCAHHTVADGVSSALFARRLAEVYFALAAGKQPPDSGFGHLHELIAADQAYETSASIHRDREFWLDLMANRPVPVSLAGRRQACLKFHHPRIALLERTKQSLQQLAIHYKSTLPQLCIALTSVYLHRMTNENDLVVGMPLTARMSRALRRQPGMMSNEVPLRLVIEPDRTLAVLLERVKVVVQAAIRHQRYRSEALVSDLGLIGQGDLLYATSVNFIPFEGEMAFDGYPVTGHNLSCGVTDDLTITIFDRGPGNGLELCLDANAALYSEEELNWHLRRLANVFAKAEENVGRAISQYDLLLPEERQLLLEDWNATEASYPSEQCIHELFEAQVQRSPEAVALVHGDETLSYGALNARANRLAHYLRELGVGPDDRVAICAERSLAMVVGLLGVLKAGGAYVPLDP
ncbi:non-ribosomal peptide synthetase, partial [Marinobacter halodurans]